MFRFGLVVSHCSSGYSLFVFAIFELVSKIKHTVRLDITKKSNHLSGNQFAVKFGYNNK